MAVEFGMQAHKASVPESWMEFILSWVSDGIIHYNWHGAAKDQEDEVSPALVRAATYVSVLLQCFSVSTWASRSQHQTV